MTMSSKILISLSLLCVTVMAATGRVCSHDYQCGNMPYAYCYNGAEDCLYTLQGVVVDSGKVYYGEICRAPDNENYVKAQKANITLKTVDIASGSISNIYTEERSRSGNIGGVWGKQADNLYINRYRRYNGLDTFNVNTQDESVVLLKFYNSIAFQTNTYACIFNSYSAPDDYRVYWNINKYSGYVNAETSKKPTILYTILAGYCGATYVPKDTKVIYYALSDYDANTTEYSSLYKGTTSCNNCQPPAPLFNTKGSISGMTQNPSDSSVLYFGTEFGLFAYTFATNKIETLTNDTNYGTIVYYDGSIIYNNGALIRSVKISTKKITDVNGNKVGTCKCAPGFTGDYCSVCNGQIQWYNGSPSCVAVDSNGVPESCTADYQCGNMPYTYCASSCQCQYGFTGSRCDQCAGNVTWSDGIPSCETN
eukprot:TRINITY_DN8783_c0_g1_i1.p1 TRINITY_DN8783_c0_g1~~TRINITY_DN8783_c0_g1_i1.p1  ORF type:complete len:443 (-),score=60.82 TRINITY_DN8783_c0_g1_i1:8-1276(-)